MTQTDPMPNADRLFERVLEAIGRTVRSIADEVRPTRRGWVASTRSLPQVFSLNVIRIVEPVSFSEALSIADDEQGDLPFRHLVIEDETTGRELEEPFSAAGWKVDCEVCMVLGDEPVERGDASMVQMLTEEQTRLVMRAWTAEQHPGSSIDTLDQLAEYQRREGVAWGERCFGVVDNDGSPLAITKLRLDDALAWVEDVFTMPSARRRGFARTLVSHVAGLAQYAARDFVFIEADDNDWPKHLYESIGFRPIARIRTFHLHLES